MSTKTNTMKVRATFHCGQRYGVSVTTVPADPVEEFTQLFEGSSHPFNPDNKYHVQAANDVDETGRAEIGWETYEIVTAE